MENQRKHWRRLLGVVTGAVITYQNQHIFTAFAMGYTNSNPIHRIGAVLFGVVVLMILMEIFRRFFSPSFFHGFMVAAGLFLSFDIVVFHWIFKLHRITSGPEANILEPCFVAFGSVLVWIGLRRELTNGPNKKTGNNVSV